MNNQILLCSDLDRTIIPNGTPEESPQARPLLQALSQREELTLVYVSGRGKQLLQQAISDYQLPLPKYAVGDVGSSIYLPHQNWQESNEWQQEIAKDWCGKTHQELCQWLADIPNLQLQEPEQQNTFKLSYYLDRQVDHQQILQQVREVLAHHQVRASLIWSVDEHKNIGLLDVLPEKATKLHAVEFLMKRENFSLPQTVFAGDSGNDLNALTSGLQAVLVKNARQEIEQQARQTVEQKGFPQQLYVARGGFLGMNGNYTAGVLEGLAHFRPETEGWLRQEAERWERGS